MLDTKERKGLSSDCTLPPKIALGLQMEGREHPCDRCNEDRGVCRGYPRKRDQKVDTPHNLKYIRVVVSPSSRGFMGCTEMRVEIEINGERWTQQQQFPDDAIKSIFDRIWEDMGRSLKYALLEE